jgi:hypothetical protein
VTPSFGRILDWLEDRLDEEASAEVAGSVAAADHRTRLTVEWLRGFLDTTSALPAHEPPLLVRQNLNAHFDRWRRALLVTEPRAQRDTAELVFDSRRDLVLAGARSADVADDVAHLAYEGDAADLVLDVTWTGGGLVSVSGQVLPHDDAVPPVFEAELHGVGFRARTVGGDAMGRFEFAAAPDTVHRLIVTNPHLEVVASLDVRESAK